MIKLTSYTVLSAVGSCAKGSTAASTVRLACISLLLRSGPRYIAHTIHARSVRPSLGMRFRVLLPSLLCAFCVFFVSLPLSVSATAAATLFIDGVAASSSQRNPSFYVGDTLNVAWIANAMASLSQLVLRQPLSGETTVRCRSPPPSSFPNLLSCC